MSSSAPWKTLLQHSLRKNEKLRHSKYIQVATVRPDGRPANRTVVYRGFLWDTDRLTFVTDSRSKKVEDLDRCPWAEISWYFPETREQWRLLGRVTVVSEAETDEKLARARLSAWKNMSDPGRQQFTWPHPGLPRATGEEDAAAFAGAPPSKEDSVAAPFCLCFLDVEEVDHLQLKGNTRREFRRTAGGEGWDEVAVNP